MARWLLLIHHLPPKPDYLRVKVRRRLQHVGALGLKNSVYVLPRRDDTLEDLEWVLSEIRDEAGEAAILDAEFLHGPSDEELEARFRAARDEEYATLAREARAAGKADVGESELARLRDRLVHVARLSNSLAQQVDQPFVERFPRIHVRRILPSPPHMSQTRPSTSQEAEP